MAIIQQSNAVFYHPLEDGVESLQADTWATADSEFGFARVGDGMQEGFNDTAAAGSWGAPVGADSGTGLVMAQLDDELFVLAYRWVTSPFPVRVVAGRVTGTTVTFGTFVNPITSGAIDIVAMSSETFVLAQAEAVAGCRTVQGRVNRTTLAITTASSTVQGTTNAATPALARLDASRAVCVYEDSSNTEVRIGVGTLDMATLGMSWTTSLLRAAGAGPPIAAGTSLAALAPDKVVVAWDESSGTPSPDFPKAVAVQVHPDNSVTVGPNAPYDAATRSPELGGMVAMSSTTALLVIDGFSFLATVSGTDLTWQPVAGGAGSSRNRLVRLDSARVMSVRYQSNGGSQEDEVFARIGTLSGATMSWGPDESIYTGTQFLAATLPDAVSIQGDTIVVAMTDAVGSGDTVRAIAGVLSRDGTAFTGDKAPLGSDILFETGGRARYTDITPLDATRFVVSYVDVLNSSHGTARVATVSGTDVTFGPESEFSSVDTGANPRLAALSATSVVAVYVLSASNFAAGRVGTVSGTDVTWGSETFFTAANTAIGAVVALSATKVVVSYMDNATSSQGRSNVGTVSGTNITWGAVATLSLSTTNLIEAAAMDSVTVVVVYHLPSAFPNVRARVGTVSGTTVTYGSETPLPTSEVAGSIAVAKLDGSKVLVCRDLSTSKIAVSIVGTVALTSIGFGAEVAFGGDGVSGTSEIAVAAAGPTAAVVSYRDDSVGPGMLTKVAKVSGSIVTWSQSPTSYQAASPGDPPRMAVVGDSLVVGYDLSGPPGNGRVNVGTISSPYPTAVAATRLAFMSWIRNPHTGFTPLVDAAARPHLAVTQAFVSAGATKGMLAHEDGSGGVIVRTFTTDNPGQKATLLDTLAVANATKPSIDMGLDLAGDGRAILAFERAGATVVQSLSFSGAGLTIASGGSTSILSALAPSVAFSIDNFISTSTPPATTTVPPDAVDNVLLAFNDGPNVKVQQLTIDITGISFGLGASMIKTTASNPSIAAGTTVPPELVPVGHGMLATEDGSGAVMLTPIAWTSVVSVSPVGTPVTVGNATRPAVGFESTSPGGPAVGVLAYDTSTGDLELRPFTLDTAGPFIGTVQFGTVDPIGTPGDGIRPDIDIAYRGFDDESYAVLGLRDHTGARRLLTMSLTATSMTPWELSTLP